MTIEKKTMYQTSDGKFFSDYESAQRHELIQEADQHAQDNYAAYGSFEFATAEDFAEFVCKYADMIRGEGEKR